MLDTLEAKMESDLQPVGPVSITILGQSAETMVPAQIVTTSGRRMTVTTELVAEPGAAVQIQSPEFVVLAEVLARQSVTGTLVLQIRHVLEMDAIAYIRRQWT